MKTLNNEITVHREETFTMEKIVQNKDGSPYIISNKLNNPYWLLSISTTRYEQENRYVKNYWLSLKDHPRFTNTRAVNLKSLKYSEDLKDSRYSGFDDITGTTKVNIGGEDIYCIAYGYVNGNLVAYDYNDAVFYVEDEHGKRDYRYWDNDKKRWIKYKCKISVPFSQEDTTNWVEQSYVYSIHLVDGVSTDTYLKAICNKLNVDNTLSNKEKYEELIKKDFSFTKGFNYFRPIATYDTVIPILTPTKLSVLSTINGGI